LGYKGNKPKHFNESVEPDNDIRKMHWLSNPFEDLKNNATYIIYLTIIISLTVSFFLESYLV